jgi:hypothetical protein
MALRSVAAASATLALAQPEAAPVATPVSIAATGVAVVDKAVNTGVWDKGDIVVTAISALAPAAGEAAAAATGVKEVSEVVKTGGEVMHAGSAAIGVGVAIIERQEANKEAGESGGSHRSSKVTSSHGDC